VGSKIEISAGKHKTCRLVIRARLLATLDVLVGRLADPWYRYLLRLRLLGCRRPCDGTISTRTCLYVPAKAAQDSDRSNIRLSQVQMFDRSRPV